MATTALSHVAGFRRKHALVGGGLLLVLAAGCDGPDRPSEPPAAPVPPAPPAAPPAPETGKQPSLDPERARGVARQVLDADGIGSKMGSEPSVGEDGVVRVTWARTDVALRVDGVPFPPAAGLTSWAAWMPTDRGAMVMGDTVVFQDEVGPAMDAAFAHGLEVTALHNHFFFDEPKAYFMHIGGHGPADALAVGVRAVWEAVRVVRAERPEPANAFPGNAPMPGGELDAAALEKIVGVAPADKGDVLKIAIPREARMAGAGFGGSMGLSSWAAFTGSDALASIDGDFAMKAAEVQPVLRALRASGIHVVALHNHMVGEQPAFFFTHFWGKGPAATLAKGFRAALDAQRAVP